VLVKRGIDGYATDFGVFKHATTTYQLGTARNLSIESDTPGGDTPRHRFLSRSQRLKSMLVSTAHHPKSL
jgi:hypothetical protein